MIKNLNSLNRIIKIFKSKNFDEALKQLKLIKIDESNNSQILKLFALIYFQKKDWINSIKYFEKILLFENEKFKIYNSIGVALFNLGKINKSIEAYKNSINENSNNDLAYNNLAISYSELGAYEEAAKNYSIALNLNNNNHNAKNNLINIFLVAKLENLKDSPLVKINNKIKKIKNETSISDPIKLEHIKNILSKSDDIINESQIEVNFNETQIFRKNSTNLDCKRHFKVFNEFNIIPKYCFSCYKIQINLRNVVELIRLFLIFDKISLEKNNIRKCIIETRHNISGNYKGYIYCDGVDEAKKIFNKFSNIINKIKLQNVKISIKHGCSEFYEPYPDYKKINFNSSQQMQYDQDWKEKELAFDNRIPIRTELDKKQIHKSLEGINLSDILIIKNWLCYASLIEDFSYKEIYEKDVKSSFIDSILKPQLAFRKRDFLE